MGAAEYSESDAETVVVFLVQAGETNAFDQRAVEHMLWEEYNVPVVRATHLQMLAHGRVDDAGVLFYEVTFAAVGFPVCFSSCYFGRWAVWVYVVSMRTVENRISRLCCVWLGKGGGGFT